MPHSTALQATLDGRRHLTGPLARYSLNHDKLTPLVREARQRRIGHPVRNPFRSIIVRAVEVVYAVEEALRIIEEYQRPARPYVEGGGPSRVGHGSARLRAGCSTTATRSTRTG